MQAKSRFRRAYFSADSRAMLCNVSRVIRIRFPLHGLGLDYGVENSIETVRQPKVVQVGKAADAAPGAPDSQSNPGPRVCGQSPTFSSRSPTPAFFAGCRGRNRRKPGLIPECSQAPCCARK